MCLPESHLVRTVHFPSLHSMCALKLLWDSPLQSSPERLPKRQAPGPLQFLGKSRDVIGPGRYPTPTTSAAATVTFPSIKRNDHKLSD